MSVDYLALGTLNLFCWAFWGFFLVVGGSGLIGDLGGGGRGRWGYDFWVVCIFLLKTVDE